MDRGRGQISVGAGSGVWGQGQVWVSVQMA